MTNMMYLPDGCPYCGVPLRTNNAKAHVTAKHKDKLNDFEKNWDTLKSNAIDASEMGAREKKELSKPKEEIVETEVEDKKDMLDGLLGGESEVVMDEAVPEVKIEDIVPTTVPVTETDKVKDEGEKKSEKGKSFLTKFNEWLDSPEF